jgi:hypothetical protein
VIEAISIGGRRSQFFLQQENWRRAIWDFCNNIGTVRDLPRAFVSLNGVVPIYYHKAIIFQIDPQQWRLNLPSHATVPVRRCSL